MGCTKLEQCTDMSLGSFYNGSIVERVRSEGYIDGFQWSFTRSYIETTQKLIGRKFSPDEIADANQRGEQAAKASGLKWLLKRRLGHLNSDICAKTKSANVPQLDVWLEHIWGTKCLEELLDLDVPIEKFTQ